MEPNLTAMGPNLTAMGPDLTAMGPNLTAMGPHSDGSQPDSDGSAASQRWVRCLTAMGPLPAALLSAESGKILLYRMLV